jgi:nitroreductase
VDTFLAIASKRDVRRYLDRPLPADVVERILDAGRLAGSSKNTQPWTFVVVESAERREALAETVFVAENVRSAALVVAIVGKRNFDTGRVAQNMFLAAWNEGVVSCPNGVPDPEAGARAIGADGEEVGIVLTFAYPVRQYDPERRPAERWSERADRKPLAEVVRRV